MSDQLSVVKNFVNVVSGSPTVSQLWKQMPWETRTEARKECFFNDRGTSYTYGSGMGERTYTPALDHDMPDLVRFSKWLVEDHFGHPFEACFINGYLNERQALGWHADDSELIDHTKPIVVISFGVERQIWVRPFPVDGEVKKFDLPTGSMFVMPAGMQQTHQHRIPKHHAACGERISLTFRALL